MHWVVFLLVLYMMMSMYVSVVLFAIGLPVWPAVLGGLKWPVYYFDQDSDLHDYF